MTHILYKAIAFSGYAGFGLVFAYYAFWLLGVLVPWTINSGPIVPLTDDAGLSLLIDSVLIGLFLVPHSVMARPAFKQWWTRYVPVPIERAVYVWYSNLSMALMIVLWQPVEGVLWSMNGVMAGAVIAAFALGAFIVVAATFCIDHFELFGLKQVFAKEPLKPSFYVRFVYKMVRHPIALGHIMMVWAAPVMSISHILYAILATVYVWVVTYKYEERDLVDAIGQAYEDYKKTTPGIFPIRFKKAS